MAGNDCESQMFANVPEGFVKLLSFIVQVAMGPSVRPVFTLYPHKINDRAASAQPCNIFDATGSLLIKLLSTRKDDFSYTGI